MLSIVYTEQCFFEYVWGWCFICIAHSNTQKCTRLLLLFLFSFYISFSYSRLSLPSGRHSQDFFFVCFTSLRHETMKKSYEAETPDLIMIEKMKIWTGISKWLFRSLDMEPHLMNPISAPLFTSTLWHCCLLSFFPLCVSFCLWAGESCDILTHLGTRSDSEPALVSTFSCIPSWEWGFYPL